MASFDVSKETTPLINFAIIIIIIIIIIINNNLFIVVGKSTIKKYLHKYKCSFKYMAKIQVNFQ